MGSQSVSVPPTIVNTANARVHHKGSALDRLLLAGQCLFDSQEGKRAKSKVVAAWRTSTASSVHIARANLPKSALKGYNWAPNELVSLASAQEIPSLTKPSIFVATPGAWMAGPQLWRCYGVGQFFFGHSGASLLLLFPGQSFLDLNIPLAAASQRLGNMSWDELEVFLKGSGARWTTLTGDRAVWVPYGWVPMGVASLSDGQSPCIQAVWPYFADDLAASCATPELLRAFGEALDSVTVDQSLPTGARLLADLQAVSQWFDDIVATGGSSDSCADGRDVHASSARPKRAAPGAKDGQEPAGKRVRLPRASSAAASASAASAAAPAPALAAIAAVLAERADSVEEAGSSIGGLGQDDMWS